MDFYKLKNLSNGKDEYIALGRIPSFLRDEADGTLRVRFPDGAVEWYSCAEETWELIKKDFSLDVKVTTTKGRKSNAKSEKGNS